MNQSELDKIYLEKLKSCENYIERISLLNNSDCPLWLIELYCTADIEFDVAKAAALDPRALHSWVMVAINRFPNLNNDNFWKTKKNRLEVYNRLLEIKQLEDEAGPNMSGDRDQIIMEHIKKVDDIKKTIGHAEAHLGTFELKNDLTLVNSDIPWAETDKFRIALVMAPAWGILFPPYNIAKLTGLLRNDGYSVKVYDLNIESYYHLLKQTNQDFWRSEKYFLWVNEQNFEKYILPYLESLFFETIKNIVSSNPKVIGFSVYNTNLYATWYLIKEIRLALPDVCIIVGGPEIATMPGSMARSLVNYIFVGEAEENLLNVLKEIADQTTYPIDKTIGSTASRLNLDQFPYPDYTDYNLNNYLHQDGVSIETSRGCVAQCSFCAETYFWKFRSMSPERVVDEIEYQLNKHGIKRFWFVDSLVNGNLKNFSKVVDLIIERNLKIDWNSYARCDGRMTADFLKRVNQSGCTCLSFGVESGSQKVLNDMRKKIEIWEIENNLRDGHNAGMFNHVNWIVGFPTEEPIDWLHSLQLLYNCKDWISSISPGFTAGPAESSHTHTHWQLYDIQWKEKPWDNKFLDSWYTGDYNNTKLHRFIRLKLTHVWLELIENHTSGIIVDGQKDERIKDFFTFSVSKPTSVVYIPCENFVKLDRVSNDTFSKKIMNEYFAFLYALYIYFGECEFEFTCDKNRDLTVFGNYLASVYNCNLKFKIDSNGNYKINIKHNLIHDTDDDRLKQIYAIERERKDMSFNDSYFHVGNINDWKTTINQTKETIHAAYRK